MSTEISHHMKRILRQAGMVSTLVHDVMGPLQRIQVLSLTLQHYFDQRDMAQAKMVLGLIVSQCSKGVSDAQHWLDIAKAKEKPEFKSQPLMDNLRAFANEARSTQDLDVEVVGEMPQRCSLSYNTQLMGVAFQQLFKNVKSKGTDRRRCIVHARFADPFVEITVDDEGPGFGGDLGASWKAIVQLDKGGLGLVMCNAVAELHHGEMSLSDWTSEDGNRSGARVRLILPLAQTHVASARVGP
jgi:signal transduction histidine kinase